MTWREDLRRVNIGGRQFVGASFRGVSFFVETAELSTGRRTVVHEFPLRDDPFVEDLGRRARKFRVDGYVIGDDYLTQKNALLTALELEGPGKLIHPYYGEKSAIGETVSVRETRADGGMAVFAIEFVETPAQAPTPQIVENPAGKVDAAATVAATATKAELVEKFTVAGLPAFAFTSAQTALTRAAAGLQAKLAPIASTTQELATFTGQISAMTSQASALVRTPDKLIDAFEAAITNLKDTIAAAPGAVMDALTDAYGTDMGPEAPETTATRATEHANQLALAGGLRRIIALEAARLAPLATFKSIEDASAARDRIAGLLEEQAAGAGDTAYPALVDLRSQVLRAIPGGAVFARVVTVTRRVAIPSLLLTYQLYGSVDQELDVVARNAIRHPGFVVGDLKVLSNG